MVVFRLFVLALAVLVINGINGYAPAMMSNRCLEAGTDPVQI